MWGRFKIGFCLGFFIFLYAIIYAEKTGNFPRHHETPKDWQAVLFNLPWYIGISLVVALLTALVVSHKDGR